MMEQFHPRSILEQLRLRYRGMTIREKEIFLGYALIGPSVILVGITLIYPLLYNVYLSFHEVPLTPLESPSWVGTHHYVELLSDPEFWVATRNTFVYTFLNVSGGVILGVFVAILFSEKFFARKLARGLVLMPYVAPTIAGAFVWRWMFDPTYGIGAFYLADILGFWDPNIDARDTLTMVVLHDTWRYFPFAFLIVLARIHAIPGELYEAAKIDGAGPLARLKDITLPQLKFIIATVFLLRWIWSFNSFASVWLFTRDVPVLGVFVYIVGFQQFNQGYAAAVSMIMLGFLVVFLAVYVKFILEW